MAAGSVGKVLAASCANLRTCLCVSRIHTKKEVWKKATCNPSTGEESRGTPELLGLGEGVQVRLWASPVGPRNQAQCVASRIFTQSFFRISTSAFETGHLAVSEAP